MDLSVISGLMDEQGLGRMNDQTACGVEKTPVPAQESSDVATCAASSQSLKTRLEAQALDAVLKFLQDHTESASMDGIKSIFDFVKGFCQRLHANGLGGQSLATALENWRRQQVDLDPVTHRAYRTVQDIISDAFSSGSTLARTTNIPHEQAKNDHRPSTAPQVSQQEANVEHRKNRGHFHPDRVAMLENTLQDVSYERHTEERGTHKLTGANKLAAADDVELTFHARRPDGRSRRLSTAPPGRDVTARVERPGQQRVEQQISSANRLVVQSNGEPASGLGRTVFHPDRMAMIAATPEDNLTDQPHFKKPVTRKLTGANKLAAQDNVERAFRARRAPDRGSERAESRWRATRSPSPWSWDRGSEQEPERQRSEVPARQRYGSQSPCRTRRPSEKKIDPRISKREIGSRSVPELFGRPPARTQELCPRSRSRSPQVSSIDHYDAWHNRELVTPRHTQPELYAARNKLPRNRYDTEPCPGADQHGDGGKAEETRELSFTRLPHRDYVCKRCGGNDHYLQDCPTHLDPSYDVTPTPSYKCAICGAAGKHLLNVCPQNTDPNSITQQRLRLWQADTVTFEAFQGKFEPESPAHANDRETRKLSGHSLQSAAETSSKAFRKSNQDISCHRNDRSRSPAKELILKQENIDHRKDVQTKAMQYSLGSKADLFDIRELQRSVETHRLSASEASSPSEHPSTILSPSAESPLIRLGTPIIELGKSTKSLTTDPPYEPRVLELWGNRPNVWVNHAARPTALAL